MSRGVLIFAQNNADVDYTRIAIFAAERVQKFLNVPVSIVTDNRDYLFKAHGEKANIFDQIIDTDPQVSQNKRFYDGSVSSKVLTWKNFARSDCYDITPYDETLVIDADYIIASSNLSKIWDSPHDLMIYRNSYDLSQWRDNSAFKYLNQHSIPFYWATAFYFQKTERTKAFFKLIQHIRQNWYYYRVLYSIDSLAFRNDFAFSMAIHILNNSLDADSVPSLPGKMYYTLDRDLLIKAEDNAFTFLLEKQSYNGEYTAMKVKNLDMHIMNKYSLSRYINEH